MITDLLRAVDNRSTTCYLCSMAESITQRELRNDSGEIMRRLDQGESFVVTRNGVPVGELTPLRRHRFVTAAAVVALFRNAPAIDPDRFRADVDAWAGQDTLPRA
jgi:prevent-host-death family protein